MKRMLLPWLAVLLLVSCGDAPKGGAQKIAIAGARLEPGGGKPVIPYSIVIVENGRIKAAGEQAEVPLPKDAEIINGLEHTIAPIGPGVIEPGKPANFIFKSPQGTRTMREGKWQP